MSRRKKTQWHAQIEMADDGIKIDSKLHHIITINKFLTFYSFLWIGVLFFVSWWFFFLLSVHSYLYPSFKTNRTFSKHSMRDMHCAWTFWNPTEQKSERFNVNISSNWLGAIHAEFNSPSIELWTTNSFASFLVLIVRQSVLLLALVYCICVQYI